MERREQISFNPNTPVKCTFAYDGGKEFQSQFDGSMRTMYTLEDDKILYAPSDLAVKVNFCEPRRGDTLWITKTVQWIRGRGKAKRATGWQVSREEPGVVQRNGYQPDTQANAQATGIEESDLERQLRESREIKEKAATRNQARENVARMPAPPASFSDVVDSTLATDAPAPESTAIARKPPQVETSTSVTQLEAALKTVLHACKSATAYARDIEYQAPPFTSDDIARMAMTLVIGKEQRR